MLQRIVLAAHLFVQQGLLGLQGSPQALHPLAMLLYLLFGIAEFLARVINVILQRLNTLLGFFPLELQGFLLFQKVFQLCPVQLAFQQFVFVVKFLFAVAQLLDGVFQRTDAGLGKLRLAASVGGSCAEFIPAMLPVAHGIFSLLELLAGFLGPDGQALLLGLQHIQFFLDASQLVFVLFQLPGQFPLVGHGLVQLGSGLAAAFPLVFDALLNTGNIRAGFVVAGLGTVKVFGAFVVGFPQGFQGGFQVHPLGQEFFKLQLGIADLATRGLQVVIQGLPAQYGKFRFFLALFLLVGFVLFRCSRLSLQVLQLPAKLFPQVGQAIKVFLGTLDAVFGFPAAFLVLGNAGRFFDVDTQFLRLGFDQPGNHTLFDDGVASRPQAGAQKQVCNVSTAALGAIEKVFGLAFPGYPSFYRNFVEFDELARRLTLGVIKHQLDGSLPHRLAGAGAVEDNVCHGFAPQVLCGALAHYPANGVNDVGFATTVRPHYRRHIRRERYRGWINKGFETGQFNGLEPHVRRSPP